VGEQPVFGSVGPMDGWRFYNTIEHYSMMRWVSQHDANEDRSFRNSGHGEL